MLFYAPISPAPNFFQKYLEANGFLTHLAEKADYLVLPFMYELIHDFKPHSLAAHGLQVEDISGLRKTAAELDELSVMLQKPLIVFFYRDPTLALPLKNALVFRTSGFVSARRKGEWGMPAFIDRKPANTHWQPKQKQPVPSISFRGKAAPEKPALSIALREKTNQFLATLGVGARVKNYQPEGYLLRRRAVLSCKKAGKLLLGDFHINPAEAGPDAYLAAFRNADYIICAAGFGNYSYRLYETLREGRIPVYIDTDELLPCADKIAWKELMVWVPAKEVDRTAQYVLDFHGSITPKAFVERQYHLRQLFEKYLTPQAFPRYLVNDFLPGLIPSLGGVPPAKR